MPLFRSNSDHFSVHKSSEMSRFLARILMKYFHMGILVIPGLCLIRKYFFSVFLYFSVSRVTVWSIWFGTFLAHDLKTRTKLLLEPSIIRSRLKSTWTQIFDKYEVSKHSTCFSPSCIPSCYTLKPNWNT